MSTNTNGVKARVMLVEDNQNLRSVLKEYFEALRYSVDDFNNGISAATSFSKNKYDICIFDIIMQGKDGYTLLEEIRQIDEDVPVVFLTAKSEKEYKIKAFRLGCDDYITKPFSTEELLLRMEAILRRTKKAKKVKALIPKPTGSIYKFGRFTFDNGSMQLIHPTLTRSLTRKEAELLRVLCEHKNKLIQREIILRQIWGNEEYTASRSMDVFITKLRAYISIDPEDEKHLNTDPKSKNRYEEGYEPTVEIKNVHGSGFLLKVREDMDVNNETEKNGKSEDTNTGIN